ncbi:DUF4468 domain-containing protein [Algoriphagus sp. A40]|uniref:DUF4468 domain-containing protein n=1 Tax=Algoriphagus sp. A40 TaxID=1945863 RepID=UPI000987C4C1|nr:DUF4468 domain-containing protein [Algoriphagus sp. A40]OOG78300.1 hypothetical protein B0E43_02555 [Algoriphagus sp. A40]
MKKTVFLIAFCLGFALMGYGQDDNMYPQSGASARDIPEPLLLPDFPMKDGSVMYQEVFDFSDADQTELFGIALRYVSEYYKSAKTVIDVTDPVTGLVVVKGNFTVMSDVYYRFFGTQKTVVVKRTGHTLKIESRPGRIRVTIDNLQVINEALPEAGIIYNESPILDLIRDYERYEQIYSRQKPKKAEKLAQVNRSILLDELDLNAYRFLQGLKPYFEKELKEDW